jgi:predicted transglutaminase-like cysteine proteinase
MLLAALFLIPSILHPAEPTMPFYDVMKREHKEQHVWQVPINKFKTNNEVVEIEAVNAYWNHTISYRINPDYWQTPEQTFERRTGNCKDYAIAKYYSLRHLGIPIKDLKFTVVLWDNQWHAVLIADGLLLDSMTDRIRPISEVDYYDPAYSINENSFWMTE